MTLRRKPSTGSGDGSPDEWAVDVGQELRQARLGFNESLPHVAAELRIREHYLAALENGDLRALPGRIYALGFARAYAGHLGLDAAVVVARLRPGVEQAIGAPVLASVVPPVERRSVTATIVTVCLATLAGGYVAYHALSDTPEPIFERIAEAPAELPLVVDPPVPAEPSPPDDPIARIELPPPPTAAAPAAPTIELPPPPPVADAASAVAAELPDTVTIGNAPLTPATDPAIPTEGTASTAASVGSVGRLELVANESSWVQVRSPTRDFFRMLTLEPGERLVLPDRADLALWTGNAGGLEVQLDGQRLGVVGNRGAVVRDLPLAPDGLRERLVP